MVESAYTGASKASARKGLRVRVPLPARLRVPGALRCFLAGWGRFVCQPRGPSPLEPHVPFRHLWVRGRAAHDPFRRPWGAGPSRPRSVPSRLGCGVEPPTGPFRRLWGAGMSRPRSVRRLWPRAAPPGAPTFRFVRHLWQWGRGPWRPRRSVPSPLGGDRGPHVRTSPPAAGPRPYAPPTFCRVTFPAPWRPRQAAFCGVVTVFCPVGLAGWGA